MKLQMISCVKCVDYAVQFDRKASATGNFHFSMIPSMDVSEPEFSVRKRQWQIPAAVTIKGGDALCLRHLYNLR